MPTAPTDPSSAADLKSAPLFDHLEELRKRLILSAVFVVIGMVIAFQFRGELIEWVKEPLKYSPLFVQGEVRLTTYQLTEPLLLSLNLSFWAGLAMALPLIAAQVWAFIAPGLYPHERRWALPFVLGAGLSFIAGVAFGYRFILPTMIPFLVGFLPGVTAQLGLGDYVGKVIAFLSAFGLAFELPVLAVILTRIGLVNHVMLRRGWRIALVAILVLAALITPTPDPMKMLLVATPLYVLYELGVLLSRIFRLPPEPVESAPGDEAALGT